jgi:hypothetical protein
LHAVDLRVNMPGNGEDSEADHRVGPLVASSAAVILTALTSRPAVAPSLRRCTASAAGVAQAKGCPFDLFQQRDLKSKVSCPGR